MARKYRPNIPASVKRTAQRKAENEPFGLRRASTLPTELPSAASRRRPSIYIVEEDPAAHDAKTRKQKASSGNEDLASSKNRRPAGYLESAPQIARRENARRGYRAPYAGTENSPEVIPSARRIAWKDAREDDSPSSPKNNENSQDGKNNDERESGQRKSSSESQTTYEKFHRDYLSFETVEYYDLPWMHDEHESKFIILLCSLNEAETDILFKHTKHLRENDTSLKFTLWQESTRNNPIYIWNRKNEQAPGQYRSANESKAFAHRQGYYLPIVPGAEIEDDEREMDKEMQEAAKRFEKDPDLQREQCSTRCLYATEYSCFKPSEENEAGHLLHLTEHIADVSQDIGLFRRRHLQLAELDFEKLKTGALELYEPRSPERLSLLMHLEAVLKDFEVHSTADTRAKRIGPWQSRTSNDKTEVFSCSIPLFHLRQYGKLAEHTPSTQISQTLLQMRYSGADRQQDLRQVICQRQGNNQCLHISYLWAIIINNDTLITASIFSDEDLFRVSNIRSQSLPPRPLSIDAANPSKTRYIHLHGKDHALWLLDRAQCQTWFQFALHLSGSVYDLYDLKKETIVIFEDSAIQPSDWPSILEKTRDSTLMLYASSLEVYPEDEPPVHQVRPRLNVDLTSSRPIGRAISSSLPSTLYNGLKGGHSDLTEWAEPNLEQQSLDHQSPEKDEADAIESFLQESNLKEELTLYHSAPCMTFGQLLEALNEELPAYRSIKAMIFAEDDQLSGASGSQDDEMEHPDRRAIVTSASSRSIHESQGAEEENSDSKTASYENLALAEARKDLDGSATSPEPATSEAMINFADGVDNEMEQSQGDESRTHGTLHHEDHLHEQRHSELAQEAQTKHTESSQKTPDRRVAFQPRSLTLDLVLLSEGIRAILGLFVAGNHLRSLDKCGQKLCAAVATFIVRLDTGILGLGFTNAERFDQRRVADFVSKTRGLLNLARQMQDYQFDVGAIQDVLSLPLPAKFNVAMYIITLVFLFAISPDEDLADSDGISHWAKDAERSLNDAFYSVLQTLQKPPLKNMATAGPKDVLGYLAQGVTGRILPDIVVDGEDVRTIYNDYIRTLEHEVRAEKASRWPVKRLRDLQYELEAMHEQLACQNLKLFSFKESLLTPEDENRDDEETDDDSINHDPLAGSGNEFTYDLVMNARWEAVQRLEDFETFQSWTQTLLREAVAQAADIDDLRNNAVVLFTIVTIVFLPLSFVASVFGMNTVDVRDMGQGQWLYWASALPFTALVVAITVWWSDLLPLKALGLRKESIRGL